MAVMTLASPSDLLWYHIVPGTYYSEGLEDGQWLSTLRGVGRLRVNATRQNRRSINKPSALIRLATCLQPSPSGLVRSGISSFHSPRAHAVRLYQLNSIFQCRQVGEDQRTGQRGGVRH